MKATIENKVILNSNLTRWAEIYQPDLLEMTSRAWQDMLDTLLTLDMFVALEQLIKRGWQPNGWLIRALAETWECDDLEKEEVAVNLKESLDLFKRDIEVIGKQAIFVKAAIKNFEENSKRFSVGIQLDRDRLSNKG